MNLIPYNLLTNDTTSPTYLIQGDTTGIDQSSGMQVYQLLFSQPLEVGNGTLEPSSFTLIATKMPVSVEFPRSLGIMLVAVAYLFNMTTELGKKLMEFIHIYVLFMFISPMKTVLYQSLYVGLMMLPPKETL
jgi:hypothetical protein